MVCGLCNQKADEQSSGTELQEEGVAPDFNEFGNSSSEGEWEGSDFDLLQKGKWNQYFGDELN
jgi:hypothetical protein